jgi:hypothetical protein
MFKKRTILRKITNEGSPCKIYVCLAGHDKNDLSLLFRRYTLTDNTELYGQFQQAVKTYKGKTLYFSTFQIKVRTLNDVIDWMISLNKPNK